MLEIEYKGANTVVITTKKAVITTDPKLSIVGLKDLFINDSIILSTEQRLSINHSESKVYIDSPGEYGVGDCNISGVAARRHLDGENKGMDSTMYSISVGDIKVAVLGNIDFNLSDDQLEKLGVIDILIIPVGGNGYTLDSVDAAKLVKKIEPKLVIPVHFEDPSLNYEVPQDSVNSFVAEMGVEVINQDKFKIKNSNEIPANLSVVILKRS